MKKISLTYDCKALCMTFLAVIIVVAFAILAWDKRRNDNECKIMSEKNDSLWKSKIHKDLLMLKHEVILNRNIDKCLYMKVLIRVDSIESIVLSNKEK